MTKVEKNAREEEIQKASVNFNVERGRLNVIGGDTILSDKEHLYFNQNPTFIAGAMWADEHPQNPQLSAADRGIIDEIIFALNSLGKEKMISYHKEIEFLNKIRKL